MDGIPDNGAANNGVPTSTTPPSATSSATATQGQNGLSGDIIGGSCLDGPCQGQAIFNQSGYDLHLSASAAAAAAQNPVTADVWGTKTLNDIHGQPGGYSQIQTTGPDGKPTIYPVWFEAVTGVAVLVYLVAEVSGGDAAAAVVPAPAGLPGEYISLLIVPAFTY